MDYKIKYAIITDEMMQLEAFIICYRGDSLDKIDEYFQIDTRISNTDFVVNIYLRDANFHNKTFRGESYTGWSISEKDYNRIKKMVSLIKYNVEFENLGKYP